MPELPEIRALAGRVESFFGGRTLRRADALQFAALKTVSPAPESLCGRTLTAAYSRGKFLLLNLDGPRIALHLSQGGRLDLEGQAKSTKPKGALVRLRFDEAAMLVKEFGTERKAGWWVLATGDDGPLAQLGPEPGEEEFERFLLSSGDGRRVHTILRDQHTVAGLGRGYTDDALHAAKLSPYATLSSLDRAQRRRLLSCVRSVVASALESERERQGGLPAKLGERFIVHNKWGRRCPVCGDVLRRVSFESHEITYCPACQTAGKVLADRRMSRLVR